MKQRLFTPGPTPVPESVMLHMASPIIHHRSPEFREVMERVNVNLQYLFQTSGPVLTLTSSGTGGVEATFVSLFSPGETIIAVNGGKFGERWVRMPRALGLKSVEIKTDWGKAPRPGELLGALKAHPEARGVYLTQSETSTGTATDIRAMAGLIRENSDALVCVDGISSIGAHEMRFDEWGVDACVTASQKGLMIPPGLAFVALGPRAQAAITRSTLPKFYFDLGQALESWKGAGTPWTPAVSLVVGVDAALALIRAEGIENIWHRHERLAAALRAGIAAMGLALFSDAPSRAVTAVVLPGGIQWNAFNRTLTRETGVTIAGGQGDFAGKIFRVAHLGYHDDLDMVAVVAALERALALHGHPFDTGAGVSATQKALHPSERSS